MDSSLEGRLSALLAMSPSDLTNMTSDVEVEEAAAPTGITNKTLQEINSRVGRIHICFPTPKEIEFEGRTTFPSTYTSVGQKEKLLLLFAENFRRQFKEKYPKRKPLVLCLPNECGVQKFVSTTIRPTAFIFSELIYNWQGIANFVADHVIYEPLEDQIQLPTRLASPETIMKRCKGMCVDLLNDINLIVSRR